MIRSVAEDGTLEGAITDAVRQLNIHRVQARSEIENTALSQYRKELLQPAPTSR